MRRETRDYGISQEEKNALLFYQGGGKNIKLSSDQAYLRGFYNSYYYHDMINVLLMPGVGNEKARLREEHRLLDIEMLDQMEELLAVYCRIYSAMCKYAAAGNRRCVEGSYRIDRVNTLDYLKQGQMYSFMSTTLLSKRFNPANYCNKNGLVILQVEQCNEAVEYIDLNAVLGLDSAYPEEDEILFAPFTLVRLEEIELNEEEMRYRDINNEPPKAKYKIFMEGSSIGAELLSLDDNAIQELRSRILDPRELAWAKEAMIDKIALGKEMEGDSLQRYIRWKEDLQSYFKACFARIKYHSEV
ncbi:MAG: hypothetical protein LIP12_18135 [Clostridiales bacterium]|nr:hypothetical protein [Clostridiales bacterium]